MLSLKRVHHLAFLLIRETAVEWLKLKYDIASLVFRPAKGRVDCKMILIVLLYKSKVIIFSFAWRHI